MDKDNTSPAPVGVQVKSKNGKGSKMTKIERLIASYDEGKGSSAQIQIQTASTVPNPNFAPKRGRKKQNRGLEPLIGQGHYNQGKPREISVEISLQNRGEERADEDSSSGDEGKDWQINIQIQREWIGRKIKRFIQAWKQIGKEDFINTGFYLRFKEQNSQQRLELNKMIIPFRGTQEEKKAYQEMLKEELEE
ncbi:MAG: hypothetical protein EZS28_048505 [Streblomastix strix]|uniref:Uncharacterized protein n=1 Tax=Streblomastix strix TaxID=222440 RepID=A0A5J4TCW6_9EUKA|nr:MAG: hypothetical protein EZS28_048505 [Streblomastix strix]